MMLNLFYIMLVAFYAVVFAPVLRLFFHFHLLPSGIRRRFLFEDKNQTDPFSLPFAEREANAAFEVSSEGELEQIRPLMDAYWQQGKRLELIYCSPSVEHGAQKLAQQYGPNQLRLLRLPLLSLNFWASKSKRRRQSVLLWMTASSLTLCRYDFFPELMLVGSLRKKSLNLAAATLKNRRHLLRRPWHPLFWYWRSVYRCFDSILTSTEQDRHDLTTYFQIEAEKISFLELRILQIATRLQEDRKQQKFAHFPFIEVWSSFLQKSFLRRQTRIIAGSYWQTIEKDLLRDERLRKAITQGEVLFALAPHQLGAESLSKLKTELNEWQIPWIEIDGKESLAEAEEKLLRQWPVRPSLILFTMKGLLCEMYSFFEHVYVGGGFGRSIHSVLEPYLAGAKVYVGPKTHRSTEFDLIKECSSQEVIVLQQKEDFFAAYLQQCQTPASQQERQQLMASARNKFSQFIQG